MPFHAALADAAREPACAQCHWHGRRPSTGGLRAWLEPVTATMTFLLLARFVFYSPPTFQWPLTHAQCERRNFLQHPVPMPILVTAHSLSRNDGDVLLRLALTRTDSFPLTGADTSARYCRTLQQDALDLPTSEPDCNTLRFQLNDPAGPPVAYSLIFRRALIESPMTVYFHRSTIPSTALLLRSKLQVGSGPCEGSNGSPVKRHTLKQSRAAF